MPGLEQVPWLYDACCAVLERTGLGAWRRWLAGGASGRVLDLGCGTGRNLPLYASHARVVGVDPASPLLRRARRRAPGVALLRARAEALPFRDHAFDTVVTGLVLCSVEDPARGLSEIRRVLRPTGTLRALEHVRATRPLRAWLQDRLQPAWTRMTGGCRPNRDTERAIERAGFVIDADSRRVRGALRRFTARPHPRPPA